jgi:gluconate 5-dehydrogenase
MQTDFPDAFSLDGQTALITGGAGGIGYGIAEAFVAAGARVVLASRTESALAEAADALGPRADYRVHDVTDFDASAALLDSIEEEHGSVTTLVNNAGVHLKKPAEDVTAEEFAGVLDVHVRGAFSLSRHAAPRMVEAGGGGSILFIASMTSLIGMPQVAAYATAKSGYLGLVRSLTTEWSADGVRVNALAPGFIDTPMFRQAVEGDPERKEKILRRTPMNDLGTVEDIGQAAVYLSSPAARFVTGVCLPVDGGAAIGF